MSVSRALPLVVCVGLPTDDRPGVVEGDVARWQNLRAFPHREQLKAWALREAWQEHNDRVYGAFARVAERQVKNGGGQPTIRSVYEFLEKAVKDAKTYLDSMGEAGKASVQRYADVLSGGSDRSSPILSN